MNRTWITHEGAMTLWPVDVWGGAPPRPTYDEVMAAGAGRPSEPLEHPHRPLARAVRTALAVHPCVTHPKESR